MFSGTFDVLCRECVVFAGLVNHSCAFMVFKLIHEIVPVLSTYVICMCFRIWKSFNLLNYVRVQYHISQYHVEVFSLYLCFFYLFEMHVVDVVLCEVSRSRYRTNILLLYLKCSVLRVN